MIRYHVGNEDLPAKITKWGKSVLIVAALLSGGFALTSKAINTIKAGPEAKFATESLNTRVTKLEHETNFILHGVEKLTHTKYQDEE